MATFLTLGNITTQLAWSRMFVGKGPARIARKTVAEFDRRSSSFFWANRGEAIAKQSAHTIILFFTVLSFPAELLYCGRIVKCRLSGRVAQQWQSDSTSTRLAMVVSATRRASA